MRHFHEITEREFGYDVEERSSLFSMETIFLTKYNFLLLLYLIALR